MGTEKLIINLDVLFINDLFMTLILLWATAKFSRVKIRIGYLFLSGIIGAIYSILCVLPLFDGLPYPIYIIFHLLLNLMVAILMIRTAFGSLRRKKFIKTLGYFYLITFIAGGAALSIYFIIGFSPAKWFSGWLDLGSKYGWFYFAALMVVVLIGKYGWNIIKEKFYKDKYLLKFKVWIDGEVVDLCGLLDTGNSLRDPLTNLPVIITELKPLLESFPTEIRNILTDEEMDVVEKTEQLMEAGWFRKFQIIPFSSVGKERGLMIGYKPDKVEIVQEDICCVGRVIIALHDGELDKEGDYQALLHPELLETA